MSITEEQHITNALRLLWGAAEHLRQVERLEPYASLAEALYEAVNDVTYTYWRPPLRDQP